MSAWAADRTRPATGGFAALAVLLLLVGLTLLAHAGLVLAGLERRASLLEARLLARRLAARAAVRHLPSFEDTLPSLGASPFELSGGSVPPLYWSTEATALDAELALLTGVARLDGLPGEARIGSIIWRLDPVRRVTAATAVLESGGGVELSGSAVTTDGWLARGVASEDLAYDLCEAELIVFDSLDATAPPRAGPLGAPVTGIPGLGMLPGDSLLARATDHLVGILTPGPVVTLGRCDPGPLNWGSPSDPTGPCGGRMALVGAPEDLALQGGEGQGVLVIRGSLRLTDGARFDGVVLVGGDLIVEGGARLVGLARVAGKARLADQGRVDGSACAAARALRPSPVLRAPIRVPDAGQVHSP